MYYWTAAGGGDVLLGWECYCATFNYGALFISRQTVHFWVDKNQKPLKMESKKRPDLFSSSIILGADLKRAGWSPWSRSLCSWVGPPASSQTPGIACSTFLKYSVAKFIVPDGGNIVDSGEGCRTGLPACVVWSQLYPPNQGLRIWLQKGNFHVSRIDYDPPSPRQLTQLWKPPPFPCSVAGRGLAYESSGGRVGDGANSNNRNSSYKRWSSSFNSLCWNFRTIFMEARNRVRKGLSYRPARLLYIGWRNRFRGIDSLAS